MPTKKLSQAEQSKRFLEAAKEAGVDGAEFDRAFGVVSAHKPKRDDGQSLTATPSKAKISMPKAKKKSRVSKVSPS